MARSSGRWQSGCKQATPMRTGIQQLVSVEGDRDEAARFLNALNLI
jgi:hypothetical protein